MVELADGVEELVDSGYKQFSTAVTRRPRQTLSDNLSGKHRMPLERDAEKETSVTAQIPLSALVPPSYVDLDTRFAALCQVLQSKGLVTEAELAEAIKRADSKPSES